MFKIKQHVKQLWEQATTYLNTRIAILKLKSAGLLARFFSKILLVAAMFVCLVFFLLLISIGAAFFINHYFANDFAGFLIIGACYPVICVLLFAFRKKLFMGIINKQILRHLLKTNNETETVELMS